MAFCEDNPVIGGANNTESVPMSWHGDVHMIIRRYKPLLGMYSNMHI